MSEDDHASATNLKRKRSSDSLSSPAPTSSRQRLYVDTSFHTISTPSSNSDSSCGYDSLFDGESPSPLSSIPLAPASLSAPPIPGLHFFSSPKLLIPQELADAVWSFCNEEYFTGKAGVNQIMLFDRVDPSVATQQSTLPNTLRRLLDALADSLRNELPLDLHALLFAPVPVRARQAIINLYHPGEGITPHVDLLKRFGDGIIGVSLGSGCVMDFAHVAPGDSLEADDVEKHSLYLPPRSIIILSGDARYEWSHGIEKRREDLVESQEGDDERPLCMPRSTRLSITFRWLLPGAEIVGSD